MRQPGTVKAIDRRSLRAAPVRMLSRVCAPAQAQEVEVPRVAEEVPQLHEEAVRHVPQPKNSDVLTPALRAAGTHGVFGAGLCREPRREDFIFVLDLPDIDPFLSPESGRLGGVTRMSAMRVDSLSHDMILCREGISDCQAKQPIERSDNQEQQTVQCILWRHLITPKINRKSNQKDRSKTSCPVQNIA